MTAAEMRALSGLAFETDATAEAAILTAQQVAEGYVNRALVQSDQDEAFYLDGLHSVLLRAYPVDSLVSVTLDGVELEGCDVLKGSGILKLPRDAPQGKWLRVSLCGRLSGC